MLKKQYKKYKVNKKHEWLMELQASCRNQVLKFFRMKAMREGRVLMKWHAVNNDKRLKTYGDKAAELCKTRRKKYVEEEM